jgi:hypothetical protein
MNFIYICKQLKVDTKYTIIINGVIHINRGDRTVGQVVRQDERFFVPLAPSEQRLGRHGEMGSRNTETVLVGGVG